MAERVQLKHLLLDHDFFEKPKILALGEEKGQLAIMLLVRIYCSLCKATDGVMRKSVAMSLGISMRFDRSQVEDFLAYCIAERLLDLNGDYISNRRVIADQEGMAKKQTKWRADYERKKSGIAAEKNSKAAEKPQNREDLNIEDLKNEDLKDLNKKGVGGLVMGESPLEILRADAGIELAAWEKHRAVKRKPLGPTEIEALILEGMRDPDGFVRSIRKSIQNGHTTLYPVPPPEVGARPSATGRRKSRDEAFGEELDRISKL